MLIGLFADFNNDSTHHDLQWLHIHEEDDDNDLILDRVMFFCILFVIVEMIFFEWLKLFIPDQRVLMSKPSGDVGVMKYLLLPSMVLEL